MRIKKIRGHKRIWRDIEGWRKHYSNLDASRADREYVKIWVHPYSGFSLLNSRFPEPRHQTRSRILDGLLDIYEAWEKELDALGQPYYLKLWLYEPRFSLSQVVCAVGDSVGYYENTFHLTESTGPFPFQNYGKQQERLKRFSWKQGLDEIVIDEDTIGEPGEFVSEEEYRANRSWVKRKLSESLRRETTENGEQYYIKMGQVWIGERAKDK